MAIRSFDVQEIRGLARARADELPNLVAIAGPNGAGKSTLLEAIKAAKVLFLEPGSTLLYVGPHRTWRSTQLAEVHVSGFPFSFEDILRADTIPQYQYGAPPGLHFLSGLIRNASTADDSNALAKTAIVRLSNQKRDLVNAQFEAQGGQIVAGTVPDLLGPLKQLVSILLPHLEFTGIDSTSQQNITVLFKRSDVEVGPTFDIDELSSGEKAAISLFLPFVEREAKTLLRGDRDSDFEVVPITMILDEPEIHLHPLLQFNVLEYMRTIAREGRAQFIFATQSPVFLDLLEDDELYVLSPPGYAVDNQLSRLSSSAERLEVARALTGSTHMLTRGKPIVFVEGESTVTGNRAAVTDERLMKILVPEVEHWAIAPARSRVEAVSAAHALRGASLHLPGMPVFGLVDSDTSSTGLPDYVVPWPVAMIENLLLDPEQLWEALKDHGPTIGMSSVRDVQRSLNAIVADRVEEEVRLRVRVAMPGAFIKTDKLDAQDAAKEIDEKAAELKARIAELDLPAKAASFRARVQEILESGEALERFHGKNILLEFYKRNSLSKVFASGGFKVAAAQAAARGERIRRLTWPATSKIKLYIPPDGQQVLECGVESPERDRLIAEVKAHRSSWELGAPEAVGREELRRALAQYARQQEPGLASKIFQLANEVGTP
ncbi:ATP-dependent endonuclease [Streptomyces sp. NPDC127105]|uniref:ATP-dependent nuclease n=1 Tax=Streptomyces sp. NPDC127105 TaxID=3345359 RepID=UPI00365C6116